MCALFSTNIYTQTHTHIHTHQHLTLHLKLIIHWSATDYLQEAEATENDRKSFPVSVVGVCLFFTGGKLWLQSFSI